MARYSDSRAASRAEQGQVVPHLHHTGICRREVLQVGFLGALGMSVTGALGPLKAEARERGPRAKSVVVVWMPGGPPQMQL